ncbi:uncharacterized protein LOC110096669 [Dendrobium catenatum]|uniref:Uncharacterized protein n=1 Tax=Dendrobium catenatum TaxID=906689 RepID=A0A2I0VPS4_9ASPA|nr:uncharacterized protein LOC110096669 [Dendrobium catenatum]XP_020678385.1 uncharacterized protein LOC110096669 [Dendrobium catenatum]PKU65411.1 hypothetical protein MA16_Dca013556 [Dendrobium catenatum]
MSRPIVLVFLLVVLIITSQFEWKQQLVNDMEASSSVSQKQSHLMNREEVVKEKIILSQEKNIQRLNSLVQSLQQQLSQCRNINNTASFSENSLTTNANETEKQQILED